MSFFGLGIALHEPGDRIPEELPRVMTVRDCTMNAIVPIDVEEPIHPPSATGVPAIGVAREGLRGEHRIVAKLTAWRH